MGPVTDSNQDVTAYIWYVPNCKGGANTVTLLLNADALEVENDRIGHEIPGGSDGFGYWDGYHCIESEDYSALREN